MPGFPAISSDTGTAEVSLGDGAGKEASEPIPKRPVTGKTAAALDTARKALSDIESRLKTVSAAASHDRKTAYDEWKASRDTLSDGAENAGGVICGYTPERNPLIKKVTVKSWDAKYSFYGRFRSDALKYAGINGSPCGKVPFFSYTPQYSQLTDDQIEIDLKRKCKIKTVHLAAPYRFLPQISADFFSISLKISGVISI